MRTWLYVPGDSARKLTKAAGTGADVCIADLVDGVARDAKAVARLTVAELMPQLEWGTTRRFIRVDPGGDWSEDINAAVAAGADGIVVPKASTPDDVERLVYTALSEQPDLQVGLILTEDAKGVLNMGQMLERIPNLAAAFFGTEDLSASLGVRRDLETGRSGLGVLETARGLFLLNTAAFEVPSIDTPYLVIDDLDGVRAAAESAVRQGFAGMQAIHPSHVPIINETFLPTPQELERARDLVSLFEAAGGGALRVDGRMVDPPHLKQARSILRTADLYGRLGDERQL